MDQFDRIFEFLGFGNPAGRIWFIGMEERGDGTEHEIQWRHSFSRLESIVDAHERWATIQPDDPPFDPTRLIPTWSCMSKLALRITGAADWNDVSAVRRYQSERLGRLNDDTFLTEILPLPARGLDDWPQLYHARFPTRDYYLKEVLDSRLLRLRGLFEQHHPECVVCYGKRYWPHHKSVFAGPSYRSTADGRIESAQISGSTIILMPFLAPYLVSNALIDEIGNLVQVRSNLPLVS